MIDASIGFDKQDLLISNYMEDKGKPFILAINKWDLIKDKKDSKIEILDKISKSLSQLRGTTKIAKGDQQLVDRMLKTNT